MNLKAFYFTEPFSENFWAEILKEIYTDQIYSPYIEGKKLKTCIDIGANVGFASYYFSQHFDEVYSLEPALDHFNALVGMLQTNGITNVEPFKLALSNTDGEAVFYHRPLNKTMYSLIQETPTNDTEQVNTIRLDTFFKRNNIEHIDLMKIDTEGSEFDILCGDGFANVADKIDLIIGEYHTWGGRNPNQLREAFLNNGFTFDTIPNQTHLFIGKRK